MSESFKFESYDGTLGEILEELPEGSERVPEIIALRRKLLDESLDALALQTKFDEFIDSLRLPAATLERCALYHVLKGNYEEAFNPVKVDRFDLEGEYSIEDFLTDLQPNYDE